MRKIGERDTAMRAAHDSLPEAYPAQSQSTLPGAPVLDQHAAYRKRLLYRSKQRGWCVWRVGGREGPRG